MKKIPRCCDPEEIGKIQTEHAQQVALFSWIALHTPQYPELAMAFAVPNGGERNKIVAANLKAEGVRAHVPDMFLPVPRGSWHGLFIELKKVGGRVDPGQTDFLVKLRQQGYGAIVCIGWEAARNALIGYLEWR